MDAPRGSKGLCRGPGAVPRRGDNTPKSYYYYVPRYLEEKKQLAVHAYGDRVLPDHSCFPFPSLAIEAFLKL